jgi:hypothetical protein
MIIPGIIAGQSSIEELYISSEPYPVFSRDAIACSGSASGAFFLNVAPENTDGLNVSGAMLGIHTLLQVVVEHTLETDGIDVEGEISGTHDLTSIVEHTLDTDGVDVEGEITGVHSLTTIIEHSVYDTDGINVAGSITGTHTLV